MRTTASVWKNARIEVVDPRTLVLADNSRTIGDIKIERPDLIDSIRTVGVLVPPIAHETPDGAYVIKDGFSRTLAALVVITEPDDEDQAALEMPIMITTSQHEADWQRLRDQYVMNEVRAGYNPDDKARILEQFTLFGFSEDEIAHQLSLDGEQVKAGLAVQRSTNAKHIMTEHPQLDLMQLAAITEFETDEDALTQLQDTLTNEPKQFDHEVARLRQHRAQQESVDQIIHELAEQGVTVVEKSYDGTQAPLRRLKLSKDNPLELRDDPEAHRDCPGHAAHVETVWHSGEPRVTYVCQDWKTHRHLDTYASGANTPRQPKTEWEKAELKRVKKNNAAWRAAEEVRRAELVKIVKRKTPPKKTQQFLTAALLNGTYELGRAFERRHSYACTVLGLDEPRWGQKHPMQPKLGRASSNDALMLQLAIGLGAFEDSTSVQTWRDTARSQTMYFEYLRDSCGYTLSPVEQLLLDPTADTRTWPHLHNQDMSGDINDPTGDEPGSNGETDAERDNPDSADDVNETAT